MTRAPAAAAMPAVSSVDPCSTTIISAAHRTLSMQAAMLAPSLRAAITTETATESGVRASLWFSAALERRFESVDHRLLGKLPRDASTRCSTHSHPLLLVRQQRDNGSRSRGSILGRNEHTADEVRHVCIGDSSFRGDHRNPQCHEIENSIGGSVGLCDDPPELGVAHECEVIVTFPEEAHQMHDVESCSLHAQVLAVRSGAENYQAKVWVSWREHRHGANRSRRPA